jgi:hypothetical protein
VASGGRATLTLERPDGTRLRSPGGSIPGEVPLIGGIAALSGVPSGEWTIVVRPPEGAVLRQQVTVSAGERKKVVLEGSR